GRPRVAAAAGGGGGPAAGDQLVLDMRAPRTTVYLHERLPFTLALRVGDVRVSDMQYPQVPGDGFALEAFPQPAQRQETRDGAVFQIVEFQGALTPLRTGSGTVGAAALALTPPRRRPGARRGRLFGGPER